MIEIKHRYIGAVIYTAEHAADIRTAVTEAAQAGADLSRANLYRADLSGANLYRADLSRANLYRASLSRANLYRANLYRANLSGADLSGADLSGANLSGADLSGADLSGANLSGANLSGAELYGATGVNPHAVTPLLMLHDQPGRIVAYKLVTSDYQSPIHNGPKLTYTIGSTLTCEDANTDVGEACGAGINLATLDWVIREHAAGWRVLRVSFTAKDIACIPTGTDGKFRVRRCKVESEVDPATIGLGAS